MTLLYLTPVFLSVLLLGAHFFRAGSMFAAGLALLFPVVLLVRRAWAARLVQLILVLGAVEWAMTLLDLASARRLEGQPWIRLAVILGLVTVFTAGSALVFSSFRRLRKRYRLGTGSDEEDRR